MRLGSSLTILAFTLCVKTLTGCSLVPSSTSPLVEAESPRAVTVAIVHVPEVAEPYVREILDQTSRFTSSELGVTLISTAIQPLPARCLAAMNPSANSPGTPAISMAALRPPCLPLHQSTADIILIALNSDETYATLLDASYQGLAQAVGGVGRRKGNVAALRLTGYSDFDTRVLLHEVGHLLGAEHAARGFMIDDALLINLAVGFSEQSRFEIRAALANRTRPFQSPARGGSDVAIALK